MLEYYWNGLLHHIALPLHVIHMTLLDLRITILHYVLNVIQMTLLG